MQLLDALNWRYATKKMNGETVPQELVDQIIEAAYLAPTSSGLQPFRVFAISNAALKEQIKPIAFNQGQITDASHILVFAAWDNYTEDRINTIFNHTTTQRGLPAEAMNDYKNMLIATYIPRPENQNFEHAARQSYIGFGMAIAAAAELKVDATPMEGFNGPELDALLGLTEKGLKSTTILTLGYRDTPNDWLVNLKKVRTPKEEFVTIID
ncbi:NAD(P)H-dependent oxidoreductase [Taibaiella sp. KBW10]|uniref:nitroreductase family protein n=1 Tax=Taibaiella sp. KBW10 TaxID=2153357 RepID=UPI000F5B8761|nr:nitroreductase family protein [Taibaiella sp. KBW10]RQO30799.1 NAD(P)H-dependent oxidoreductase [Taibaiella sp. KBW10]